MAFNRQSGYYEEDKVCFSEQSGYGRPAGYVRPYQNNMGVTACESYTVAGSGYGQGGGYYAPTPGYNSGACFERKEEVCMSNSGMGGGHHMMRPFRHHGRRRVMRHSESRGSYSCSESDSD